MPRAGAALDGRPSLDLLRRLSDGHVLGAVLDGGPGSRADLAGRTGLSKPTVGQSATRLLAAGILSEAEPPLTTRGRGRIGTVLELDPGSGCAVVMRSGPQGLAGELVLADGQVLAREDVELGLSVTARGLGSAVRSLGRRLAQGSPGPIRAAAVSVADPVDRRTGRTVHLPGAPFLIGDLDVPRVLAALDVTPVVDNDVNWTAIAERRHGATVGLEDVLHVHLGEGIGAAVVADGRLVRGHRGLAGEIAYAVTSSESARGGEPLAGSLLFQLSELGLLVPGSRAIAVERVAGALARGGTKPALLLDAVSAAVRGACHLLDPQTVVLTGPWGLLPAVVEALTRAVSEDPVLNADVRVGLVEDAPLVGARIGAVAALRSALLTPES